MAERFPVRPRAVERRKFGVIAGRIGSATAGRVGTILSAATGRTFSLWASAPPGATSLC